MIDIKVNEALKQPGKKYTYNYSDKPNIDGIIFKSPLILNAEYSAIGVNNDIHITGKYNVIIKQQCVRCLDETTEELTREFEEIFKQQDEPDSYVYSDNTVSLDKMIYDDILLNIAPNPICKEDCHGICPTCGKNLNVEVCNCKPEYNENENNPFSKLKNLF